MFPVFGEKLLASLTFKVPLSDAVPLIAAWPYRPLVEPPSTKLKLPNDDWVKGPEILSVPAGPTERVPVFTVPKLPVEMLIVPVLALTVPEFAKIPPFSFTVMLLPVLFALIIPWLTTVMPLAPW